MYTCIQTHVQEGVICAVRDCPTTLKILIFIEINLETRAVLTLLATTAFYCTYSGSAKIII